jgi:hypothetical protein
MSVSFGKVQSERFEQKLQKHSSNRPDFTSNEYVLHTYNVESTAAIAGTVRLMD